MRDRREGSRFEMSEKCIRENVIYLVKKLSLYIPLISLILSTIRKYGGVMTGIQQITE